MSDYPECDEAELLVKGCDFPWIRPDFDTEKCSQTYAERISPYHTNCCAIYGTISGLLWCITGLWFVNSYIDFMEKRVNGRLAPRGSLYRMRMHFFASAASFCNLLACVDLKGYAARQPLLLTETFNELAFSCVLCVLFHMVNQWVDVITLGGRTEWGKRQHALLPWMCAMVAVLRVGLGLSQWLAVPNGLDKARYNGTLNALKLLTTFLAVAFYTAIGMYASIYQPMQVKKRATSSGGGGAGAATAAAAAGAGAGAVGAAGSAGGGGLSAMSAKLSKKKVMNTYYLVGLFVILFFYCIYLVVEAAGRFGSTEQRNVPCSFASKNWFTNQGTILFLVGLYMAMKNKEECDPAKGGGCSLPTSPDQRRQRRLAAARKKQDRVRLEAEKERKEKAEAAAAKEAAVDKAMMGGSDGDVETGGGTNTKKKGSILGLRQPSFGGSSGSGGSGGGGSGGCGGGGDGGVSYQSNPSTVLVDQKSGKRTSSLGSDQLTTGRTSTTSSVGLVEVELASVTNSQGEAAGANGGTVV